MRRASSSATTGVVGWVVAIPLLLLTGCCALAYGFIALTVKPPPITTAAARTLFAPLEDSGSRAELVARRLGDAIRVGLVLDGERLPAETELAAQFGVSTVTLREALTILRAQGISSVGDSGRQTNTLRRLGVSETPVTVSGPVMLRSRRCGRMVMPTLSPYSVSASV